MDRSAIMQRPKSKKRKLLSITMVVLGMEKILQHALLSLAFIGVFPALETPDIGQSFTVNSNTMALFNLLITLLFGVGILGKIKNKRWGIHSMVSLAVLDIILEFLFHGLFYITVSVIISAVLIIISILYLRQRQVREE